MPSNVERKSIKCYNQAEHRDKIKAIQILAPSQLGDGFVVNEDGIKSVLGHSANEKRKVVIISVAGAFRKGKSFLLNIILEYLYALHDSQQKRSPLTWLVDETKVHGFHWKAGAHRDTAGIWMWGEPIIIETTHGEKIAVVLLDTQGTFDNQSTMKQWTTIFALSTLVSSLQIYNLFDAIQENDLHHLSLFIEYGRLAKKHAAKSKRKTPSSKPLQSLCFCVRDFKAPQDFPWGEDGGRAYLNHILNKYPGQDSELRDVREHLSECFENLSCFLLPHPGFRVSETDSFGGEVDDLRPVFREKIREMVESLLSPESLQPKSINGTTINCKKMIPYFKAYAEALESSSMPRKMSIVHANAQLLNNEARERAMKTYRDRMNEVTEGRSTISERKLRKEHTKSCNKALMAYDTHSRILIGAFEQQEKLNLQSLIETEFEHYIKINSTKPAPLISCIICCCLECH